MYLLDTCVLLWLASDQNLLSEKAKSIIRDNADSLYISVISSFKIAIKTVKRKIELPLPPDEWYKEAVRLHAIEEMLITSKIASMSALLPRLHNDPCDRIIFATALQNDMTILTKDKNIASYPKVKVAW